MLVREERFTLAPTMWSDTKFAALSFSFQHVIEAMEWVIHHYANDIQFYVSFPDELNNAVNKFNKTSIFLKKTIHPGHLCYG